ncbi:MAG: hypothetical protein WC604_02255 [Candidatus Gracilibacteria bacterium]
MRNHILPTAILLVVVLIAPGCSINPVKPTSDDIVTETTKQQECLVQLDISRDDNPFRDKSFGDIVKVDDQRFSELTKLDATRPEDYADKGGEKVGKLVDLSDVDYRDAAVYLVKNQILQTYWHLGSKVCLADEMTDKLDTLYAAHFTGTHEYCTNECETGELDFRVMIEKDSGFIYLAK